MAALSDGRTPGSRRSHPGSGAPRGDTVGARPGTDIYEDRPGTRSSDKKKNQIKGFKMMDETLSSFIL